MIAQRMCTEGAEKTWDQCRIKLKNLKSQYRYVKERIPNIDDLDLEDDDVVRQLIAECQGRGISPSSIKHLRSLLRFLNKQKEFAKKSGVPSDFLNPTSLQPTTASSSSSSSASSNSIIAAPQPFIKRHQSSNPELSIKPHLSVTSSRHILKVEEGNAIYTRIPTSIIYTYYTCHELRLILHFLILDKHNTHFDDDAVSPPSSPTPGLKIIQGMKQT